MAVRLSTITSRSTIAIVCTLAIIAISSISASTQGTSGSNQQISVLQQQLSALDRRVKSLEDAASAAAAADQVKQEPASAGSKPDATTLEARIAQLEAEVRSLQSQEAAAGGSQPTKSQGPPSLSASQVLTVRAPFKVLDAGGRKVLLEVGGSSNNATLTIGDPTSGSILIGVGSSGSGAVVVRGSDGKKGAALGNYQGSMGVHVFASDGEAIEGSLALDEEHRGQLQVGPADQGSVKLGVGPSGAGFVSVRTTAGKTGVGLGVFQNAPMGVYVLNPDGQRIEASMTTSQEGGNFRLNTNGKQAVQIDKSSIVFYADSGSPLSLFGTKERGKGYMELNDSGGMKMVEAGMLNSRVGYVLATPYRSSVDAKGNPSVLMGGAGR
ncbi:MAG TPA: FlxA-like family protein [Terracidiphilus sp.]|nr:FlxA-like family protein [Terracidiphilus sp.]